MENNPFIFNLSEKIEYSKDGDFYTTASIELTAPNMSVFDLSTELSQLVMRAFLDASDFTEKFGNQEVEPSKKPDVDGTAIKMILLSSKSVKFSDIADICKKLFIKVGTFDGKTNLKPAIINRLSVDDFTGLICGYVANFIYPSLFLSEGD